MDIDTPLERATEILLGDLSDEEDAELESLLRRLFVAGCVAADRESNSGDLWRFTAGGVEQQEALGLLG